MSSKRESSGLLRGLNLFLLWGRFLLRLWGLFLGRWWKLLPEDDLESKQQRSSHIKE